MTFSDRIEAVWREIVMDPVASAGLVLVALAATIGAIAVAGPVVFVLVCTAIACFPLWRLLVVLWMAFRGDTKNNS